MEEKNIIIILATIIILLVITFGTVLAIGNINPLNTNDSKVYDFGEFTMNVSSNATFTNNTSTNNQLVPGQSLFIDENNSLMASFAYSSLFNDNASEIMSQALNKSGEISPVPNISNLNPNCKIYKLNNNNSYKVQYLGTFCVNNTVVMVGANNTEDLVKMLNSITLKPLDTSAYEEAAQKSITTSSNSNLGSSSSDSGSDILTEGDLQQAQSEWGDGGVNPNYGKYYRLNGGLYRDDCQYRKGAGDLTPVDDQARRNMEAEYA
ncbi:hypothetical protein [Methanobrevibacter sp. UBA417]|jgi:hypothetical protein|uniref:hypothetical protein n=1 Tax=Methanobrevibacter sp. UBA417 TaxID=1915487 RepID=UPI0039B8FC0C